jgi:hypothetical protein
VFVSDRLIFLQLQKTACTHIASEFERYLDGRIIGKHNQLEEPDPTRTIVGSIRNPWDWYVSLWAYGCKGRGGIHKTATETQKAGLARIMKRCLTIRVVRNNILSNLHNALSRDPAFWKDCYRDPNDERRFRKWLKAINSNGRHILSEGGYHNLPLSDKLGFYSFRVLKTATPLSTWRREATNIISLKDSKNFFEQNSAITRVIRMENLETDLAQVLSEIGVRVDPPDLAGQRTNTSKHRHFLSYYDEETLELVANRDQFVIDTFGYERPNFEVP